MKATKKRDPEVHADIKAWEIITTLEFIGIDFEGYRLSAHAELKKFLLKEKA